MIRLATKDFVNYAPIILNMLVIQEAELSPAFYSKAESSKPGYGTR